MRRTKVQMTAAALMAAMLLGGCGEEPYDLTENEKNVIVNYAAHVVTKYNTYQSEGLTYVLPEEETETVAEQTTEPQAQGADTQTPDAQGADAQTPDAAAETAPPVNAASQATFSELFGDGTAALQFSYVGARLDSSYLEKDYFAMYPDTGNVYVILGVDVTNTSDAPVTLDNLSRKPEFTAVVNGTVKSPAEMTLLDSDFSTFQGMLTAGETREMVLIFQVPDTVVSLDALELYVKLDENIQIILENA